MKTLVAALFTLSILGLPPVAMTASAQTMTVLLPLATYPEISPVPDEPGTPETGVAVTPTVTALAKDCDQTADAPVRVLQDWLRWPDRLPHRQRAGYGCRMGTQWA